MIQPRRRQRREFVHTIRVGGETQRPGQDSIETGFLDFSEPTLEKILKKINIVVFGGASQSFVTKWGYDYGGLNYNQTLSLLNSEVAQYGLSEYNTTAEYSGSEDINSLIANGLGYGKVLQLGFEVDIENSSMSIQKFEVFVKSGRTI